MEISKKIFNWIKKEIVFFIIFCLTIFSMFFVPPSAQYLDYIDWNTIFILFSLMAVVAGFSECGIFTRLGEKLCSSVRKEKNLYGILIFLCFFTSMLITNDVALLTFVPFTIALLGTKNQKQLIWVIVLQTMAANLGSMLTPIGNPQNLFLFSQMNLNLQTFLLTMFPLTFASAIFLFLAIPIIPTSPLELDNNNIKTGGAITKNTNRFTPWRKTFCFFVMFLLSVLTVLHVLSSWITALIVLVWIFIIDKKILKNVDYMLLLTFIGFFIFTGNIASIPDIHNFLQKTISSKEFFSGIIASQIISNVPATLMLFPFSTNLKDLLLGVNLGGLGTLVGSLASLISFKLYVKNNNSKPGKYLFIFTTLNGIFLALLIVTKILLPNL